MTDYLMLAGLKAPPPILFGGGVKARDRTEARRMQILLSLKTDRSTTLKQVMTRFALTDGTARNDLASLVKRGLAMSEEVRAGKITVRLWRRL